VVVVAAAATAARVVAVVVNIYYILLLLHVSSKFQIIFVTIHVKITKNMQWACL